MNSGTGSGGGAAGGSGGGKRGLFDDLAGMAGGAFSVLAGARQEAEAMGRAQLDAMVQRLDLVKREDLDAALEVARRAREQAEALEAKVVALEARIEAMSGLEARLAEIETRTAHPHPPANDPTGAANGE
ncbi:accessory factor UbiK family protein [Roseomonas stagni]|uniref:Accessory factor UbiK family protein n=1 Tax=Falsiroseomonas algicola TaxID=2716930 RepID=A0A6M1LNZ2_9PROT|nr:accessory factor UbiK family protein [Falsiroseomonas algicola]NGM22108.1 accessory factor UbiK family protein [Falsiroseomonas algicola]